MDYSVAFGDHNYTSLMSPDIMWGQDVDRDSDDNDSSLFTLSSKSSEENDIVKITGMRYTSTLTHSDFHLSNFTEALSPTSLSTIVTTELQTTLDKSEALCTNLDNNF